VDVAVTVEQCWHRVPGGTAVSTLELLQELHDRDDVRVLGVAARHRRPPEPPWRPPMPVRHLRLPRSALYEAWHALRWPRVEQATGPVDVVHATAVAFPAAAAPVVVTVHDLAFLHDDRFATRHGARFMRRGFELARRHARLVLCPSRATADECEAEGIERDRLRIVPWGVRPAAAGPGDVARVREVHGLHRRYVLFTGTVEPRKNLTRLAAAFDKVASDHDDVDLVLTGPAGWNEKRPAGSRVRALGFVPARDLDALFAGASVFAYPSLREGFGLPVLEAMAHGAPVVTSRGTATEEVAGKAAIVVDPLDVDAIAGAISSVLDDETAAESMAAAGRERAAEFTWDRSAELTADAYEEALAIG
jgi:glycosyltransferase involved in cell wall biosynthesis